MTLNKKFEEELGRNFKFIFSSNMTGYACFDENQKIIFPEGKFREVVFELKDMSISNGISNFIRIFENLEVKNIIKEIENFELVDIRSRCFINAGEKEYISALLKIK